MSEAFHRGEQELQARAGSRERLAAAGPRVIRDFMPEQHRELFGKLPWLFASTLDVTELGLGAGRPPGVRSFAR
jgi:predicted pyridoxine 5'-phosphate oxidase superfamily flavin-nucleotide-binding protein